MKYFRGQSVEGYFKQGVNLGRDLKKVNTRLIAICELAAENHAQTWFLGRDMEAFYFSLKRAGVKNVRYLAGLNREASRQPNEFLYNYLCSIGVNFRRDYFVDTGFAGSIFNAIIDCIPHPANADVDTLTQWIKEHKTRMYLCTANMYATYPNIHAGYSQIRTAIERLENAPKREYVEWNKSTNRPWVRKHADLRFANAFIEGFIAGVYLAKEPTPSSWVGGAESENMKELLNAWKLWIGGPHVAAS